MKLLYIELAVISGAALLALELHRIAQNSGWL